MPPGSIHYGAHAVGVLQRETTEEDDQTLTFLDSTSRVPTSFVSAGMASQTPAPWALRRTQ